MNALRHLSLALGLGCLATLAAQEPLRVEYFLDADPGHGAAVALADVHVGSGTLTFDLSAAAAGPHVLYVRSQDAKGRWSPTVARPLFIDSYQDIVRVEYFFDGDDPGIGRATPISLPEQDYKAHFALSLQLDVSRLALGGHTLSVRARDRFDQWTDILTRPFSIVEGSDPIDPEPQVETDLSRLEYFFDTDPGHGKGTPLEQPRAGTNIYVMDFAAVQAGAHVLYLRAADESGQWSATVSRPLYVMPSTAGLITAIEYYFDDADPGCGNATAVELPEDASQPMAFDVDIDGLALGEHQLSVRVRDDAGRWSLVNSSPFSIGSDTGIVLAMPVSFRAEENGLVLAGGNRSSEWQVEVFTLSGIVLHSCPWPATVERMALRLPQHTSVVIKITDPASGRMTLRKIVRD